MQKILRFIARLIVARHECTYVRHCKGNAPIYMYYVAPETPMMSSVIADCTDLAPPQYFGQVYAYGATTPHKHVHACSYGHGQCNLAETEHRFQNGSNCDPLHVGGVRPKLGYICRRCHGHGSHGTSFDTIRTRPNT